MDCEECGRPLARNEIDVCHHCQVQLNRVDALLADDDADD
jgi:hypothetical protein